jgi:hypothetical protein
MRLKALAEIYTMHSFAPFGIESQKPGKPWGEKNLVLCTVLVGSVWVKKYTKINRSLSSIFSLEIAENFTDF